MNVLVVVPAWNVARNLEDVVGELRERRPLDDIVVVNDGSADRTAEVARGLDCRVVSLPFQLGYGAAVQTGIKYGLRHGYAVVVTFDGDGQHDPADIEPLVTAVRAGADLALGSRVLAAGSHHGGALRRAGRALFSALARLLAGLDLTDPTTGLKAFGPRSQELFALTRFPDRFPDVDALVLARRANLSVVEPACAPRAIATASTAASGRSRTRSTCCSRSSWPRSAAKATCGGETCRCARRSSSSRSPSCCSS
jgi:glycosyltransferase involved in cell wall biosynthesis